MFHWEIQGLFWMCSSKSFKKSKRKLYLVKELDANSFKVSIAVLKGCVLALWHKIEN